MELISAKEAYEKTKEIVYNCYELQMQEIMEHIEKEVMAGSYYYCGTGNLSKNAKDKLIELGYEVQTGSQYNEPYYSISWKKE